MGAAPTARASRSAPAACCWRPGGARPRTPMWSAVPRLRLAKRSESAIGERFSTHATVTFAADFDEPLYPSAGTPPMGYFVKKYDVDDQAKANPERDNVRYALEGMLNHPMAHAQVVPYESAESHQALDRKSTRLNSSHLG